MGDTIDLKSIIEISSKGRLSSMRVAGIKEKRGGAYSVRLESTGKRKGYAEITIQKSNGTISLDDYVSLPENNKGFEEDIVLLKQIMFQDLGAVASGAVKNLGYRGNSKGHTLSFKVTKEEEAQKALKHYIDIAFEVMSSFFKGIGEIDLAFSLARQRIGR